MADSSSTSSSRSSGVPRALLLAAALVVVGEALFAFALPVNQGRHMVDDLLADLERPQPTRPIVAWCDSVTEGALEAAGGDPLVTDLSSTQAVSMAGAYFTYLRLLEVAAPPRVLVLSLVPESYGNNLDQVFTPTYFETCFLRWGEIRDFAFTTGRWRQAAVMAGNRLLLPPSVVRRASVRRAIQRLRHPGGPGLARVPLYRVVGADPAVLRDLQERTVQREFVFPEISRLYLEKLAAHAESTGTRLVLMTGALPRSAIDGWRRTGYADRYLAALAEIAALHRNVTVEPIDRFATWSDVEMYDRVHLKPVPAEAYGRKVFARLREIANERAAGDGK